MNFDEYQAAANRTSLVSQEDLTSNLVHASLGLTTEVGEFVTEVKRIARYAKPCTQEMRDHMAEELGDAMWYIALAATALGVPMGVMATSNIAKLMKRFPEKYSHEAAEARADKGGADARSS
jgi:NTP pyrophosphatase (non-canonical NTP hydrolase)